MNIKIIIGLVILLIVIGGGAFLFKNQNGNITKNDSMSQTKATTKVTAPENAKNSIAIKDMAFSQDSLTVKVGEQVTWTNEDSVSHSATADDSSFDTGVLAQGESRSVSFSNAGTYTYHCSVHPSMTATIIVTE